ncbi:hypothetical protein CAPTEDRAFT_37043, partial [Capitella teleta]
ELTSLAFWRDLLAEFVMTFMLMSVQAALPLDWGTNGLLGGPVQVGLGVGFLVTAMAWALGDFSGGHINPAVSIAMMACAKISPLRALFYVASQSVGAVAGAGFVYGMIPSASRGHLSATSLGPGVEPHQGFLIEAWITCLLVLTVFGSTNKKRKGSLHMPAVPIGLAVALGIMTGVNAFGSTGGSMNPARSLGPAVVLSIWDDHWVYWAGPICGGLLAAMVY